MTPAPVADVPGSPLRSRPSVRGYTILCLTGLMGMVLALVENDRDLLWVLLLAAVGAAGVVGHWRIAPPLLLLGLAALEWFHLVGQPSFLGGAVWEETIFMDAVLAASVLTYAAGHCRLLALVHTIFPIDLRQPPQPRGRDGRREPAPGGRQRRSPELPGPWEMPLLAIAAGMWAVGVSLFWLALTAAEPPLYMSAGLWRGLLLVFLVGLTTAVLAGAAAYLHWAAAAPEEHLLYLQDQLWRETRREQNRINRFLTWARLRAQQRKEQT